MIGILTTPTKVSTPLARALVRGSSIALRRPITPRYRNSRSSSEVSLASHTQYVPHMGLPHSMPVTNAAAVNEAPSGAQLAATTSASFIFHTKLITAAPAMTMYTNSDIHADGT